MRIQTIPRESALRGEMMAALYAKESLMNPQDLEIVDVISTKFPKTDGEFVIAISDQKPTEDRPWNIRFVTIFGYDHLGIEGGIRPIATTKVLVSTHGLMTYPAAIRNWLRDLPDMPQHMLEEYMLEESTWTISNDLRNAYVTLSVLYSLLYGNNPYSSKFIEEIKIRFPGQLKKSIEMWSNMNLWKIDYCKRSTT